MSKPEKIYILSGGRMCNDYSQVVGAAKTKTKAAKLCRDQGCGPNWRAGPTTLILTGCP